MPNLQQCSERWKPEQEDVTYSHLYNEWTTVRTTNAVSFQDLVNAVRLRKASIFHHFPNNKAVASALIERCSSKHSPEYTAVVKSTASAPEKLRGLAEILQKGLQKQRRCLLAALRSGVNTLPEVAVQELGETARGAVS